MKTFLPILTGILCFLIALWQFDDECPERFTTWWWCLSFLGRVAVVGFGLSFSWFIYANIFSKKP